MGYKEGEYPFEGTWRTDGVTSSMVIEFCKQYNINCMCVTATNRIIANHKAAGERKSNVIFFVRDDHCFWYGSEAKGTAANKAPSAANAFSQKLLGELDDNIGQSVSISDTESEDDNPDEDTTCDGNDFKQKEIRAFFASDKTPPMTEWKCFHEDLQVDQGLLGRDPNQRSRLTRRGEAMVSIHAASGGCGYDS